MCILYRTVTLRRTEKGMIGLSRQVISRQKPGCTDDSKSARERLEVVPVPVQTPASQHSLSSVAVFRGPSIHQASNADDFRQAL